MDYIKKEYIAKLWADTIGKKYWDTSRMSLHIRLPG
jgi:hypothetical protein